MFSYSQCYAGDANRGASTNRAMWMRWLGLLRRVMSYGGTRRNDSSREAAVVNSQGRKPLVRLFANRLARESGGRTSATLRRSLEQVSLSPRGSRTLS